MWTPTHVQVTVQRAKGLLLKGKNGTNDAFVTICLGKEKYQTSVKERAADPVEWHEECELAIPRHGNKAEIVLTVLHRNFIGDEFLGQVTIPLSDFDVYDKPKNRWYALKCKPGQDKTNYRGDIEVRVSFTVQSGVTAAGSLSELKKDGIRASFGQLSQKVGHSIGGSLLSLKGKGDKKGLKGLAKAVGSKVNKVSTLPGRGHKKKGLDGDGFGAIPEQLSGSTTNISGGGGGGLQRDYHRRSEADPGVISDDEDEFRFDELSHKSSHSSLSVSQVALGTPRDGSLENLGGGEFLRRNYATPPPVKPSRGSHQGEGGGKPDKPERWSAGPVDDWETKLFGKQQTLLDRASNSSLKNSSRNSMGSTRGEDEGDGGRGEETKEEGMGKRDSFDGDSPLKPTFQSIFSKAAAATTTKPETTISEETSSKEPVPKPRHSAGGGGSAGGSPVPANKKADKVKSPAPSPPQIVSFKGSGITEEKPKSVPAPAPPQQTPPPAKTTAPKFPPPSSHTTNNNNNNNNHSFQKSVEKETPSPLITPPSKAPPTDTTTSSSGGEDVPNNQKWTPVGITNPIRQKDYSPHPETRLPRELIKKFESKSREDLIEVIMKQQTTLEYQRQKLNDMEDYIDNLLVRVMEVKPTLLQTPYVTHRPMKFSAEHVADWFALSD